MTAFSLIDRIDDHMLHDLMGLYRNEWWCQSRQADEVRAMLETCDLVIGLVDDDKQRLVAFARVFTDQVYKATVFDVIVHADYRGLGLGDRLMTAIVEHPTLVNVESIELYCLPGMADFYARFGFSSDVAGCILMRRRSTKNGK